MSKRIRLRAVERKPVDVKRYAQSIIALAHHLAEERKRRRIKEEGKKS